VSMNGLFPVTDADVCNGVNIDTDITEDLQGAVGGVAEAEVT